MPSTTQAVSLGVLILFVAFLFPTLISAPQTGTAVHDVTLNDGGGGTETVGDALRIVLVEKTDTDATLNVSSLESGEMQQVTVTETETTQLTLDNQTVTITADDIEPGTSSEVGLTVRYPSNFAWPNDASRLSDNLPIVMAAVALLIVLGLLGAVIRS